MANNTFEMDKQREKNREMCHRHLDAIFDSGTVDEQRLVQSVLITFGAVHMYLIAAEKNHGMTLDDWLKHETA